MKQILQSLRDGTTYVSDVPAPRVSRGQVLVRTRNTLVSAGTERMLVEFGRAGWLEKARQQPDKLRMVLDKIRADGLLPAIEAVQSKLDQPLALGYCNVGVVVEVGESVRGFAVGDRVVSNGKHAEFVVVPANLCAHVPQAVSDEQAVFTVVAAVGLQGIRLAAPTLGECVAVTGLGLIGLLTLQLLRAQGCRVLGLDYDSARLALARRFGAETVNLTAGEDALSLAMAFSRGRGLDAAIITASAKSSEPVSQAAHMCRKRGRIVLVGVTGLKLSRADFYQKELSLQVSCSYGPGRYDSNYEEGGHDYPVGFVRWTEQRNFEAVLDLLAAGRLDVAPLVSHRFPIAYAPEAYALLLSGAPSLGIVLDYPEANALTLPASEVALIPRVVLRAQAGKVGVAFVGAGNYAGRVLIPAFRRAGADLYTVTSSGGVSAVHFGRKYGVHTASTDWAAVVAEDAVNAVVIATRHNAHAEQVLSALRAGKHVFCEKPLCLSLDELAEIDAEAQRRPSQLLMVGFNRRFAPQIVRMRTLLAAVAEPKSFVMTVNAGAVPADHWTQDKDVGGGRIVGEACHFVDLLRHLAGSPIVASQAVSLGRHPLPQTINDNAAVTLQFADGSTGMIHYLANGNRGFPKERLEVFCSGRVLQLDNFRRLRGWGWKGFSGMSLFRQNKGQLACVKAFVQAVEQEARSPIALGELLEVSRTSIELQRALGG